ncbi:hypothetical protein M409DRAFT_68649 [Zasmidium cellare ATCC 36951]|uniref:NmrA-like domain-containing protein n=1 Tax=Zasmidium cellare ATCC 36951 TaxID=1080233 RepID=A0A6A6C7G4_ZASCE|nr:uncharacterized protein M409DRAFT_68649 [Zasmidium cellare ATCC 36951]KAF2162991.1 hypothetical protein M409DRAFT_68649 [Zasmidium cellare ATCC 36951]
MAVDLENDLILVTAASGKQGGALLPFLARTWKRLRLQCVSDSSRERLHQQYPHAEIVQTDFADLASARRLMQGVTACVLVTPAFHPRESHYGLNMIDAAAESLRSGGLFKHLVLSSVLHSCLRALANHDNKRFVEEALIESILPYTIVQPSHVMENVPVTAIAKQDSPVFHARFDPATKFSFSTVYDLGEAISNILRDRDQHLYAVYPLVSTPEPLNYYEAMDILSARIGKQVQIQRLTMEDITKGFATTIPSNTNDDDRKAILRAFGRLMVYYDTRGLIGNAKVLELVLGRKPLGYREWVDMQLK